MKLVRIVITLLLLAITMLKCDTLRKRTVGTAGRSFRHARSLIVVHGVTRGVRSGPSTVSVCRSRVGLGAGDAPDGGYKLSNRTIAATTFYAPARLTETRDFCVGASLTGCSFRIRVRPYPGANNSDTDTTDGVVFSCYLVST